MASNGCAAKKCINDHELTTWQLIFKKGNRDLKLARHVATSIGHYQKFMKTSNDQKVWK